MSWHRHHQQFPRSPGSSVDMDTSHLRMGVLTPTSPAGAAGPTSSSPPMSDFGMDLGQVPAATPTGQTTANAMGQEAGSRSSSFSGGVPPAFGELVGDGQLAAQLGLGGRGAHIPIDRHDRLLLLFCHTPCRDSLSDKLRQLSALMPCVDSPVECSSHPNWRHHAGLVVHICDLLILACPLGRKPVMYKYKK